MQGTMMEKDRFSGLALPFCLLSAIFFMLYGLIIAWFLKGAVRWWLELFFPFSIADALAGSLPYATCGLLLLLSAAGSVLLVRNAVCHEHEDYPFVLLLWGMFGVIIASAAVAVFLQPEDLKKIPELVALTGFASLPLLLARLPYRIGPGGSVLPGAGTLRKVGFLTGIVGISCALALAYSALTYVPPPPNPYTDNMFNFDPLAVLAGFFGLLTLAFLMPVVGILLLRMGFRVWRAGVSYRCSCCKADSDPAVNPRCFLPDFSVLSPTVRWIIILLIVAGLIAGGFFVTLALGSTMPGASWTRATSSAPFGSKGAFASQEFKGKLWLIGGTGRDGTMGEAWNTSDGLSWDHLLSPDLVPLRMGASSAVFRQSLFVIGGTTEISQVLNNDVWMSKDGLAWTQVLAEGPFRPRNGHSSVVFQDRIWVIGGNLGTEESNLTSDIWYSDDGIAWHQATPAAEFSPRSGHTTLVYRDRLYLIGGWDESGDLNDVWSSADGIHWTRATASAAFARGCPAKAVVFENRMWVFQNFYVMDPARPWIMDRSQGIWVSTDGSAWTKVPAFPEFFQEEYSGGPPHPVVFGNRLYILQWHNSDTGIWYMPPS